MFFSVRALLAVKGKDPKNEKEAFSDFEDSFIKEGITSPIYANVQDVFKSMDEKTSPGQRRDSFSYASKFLEHINKLYKSMDSTFKFPRMGESSEEEEILSNSLDLKGTPCPINYVKVKLALEKLNQGDTLEVFLDEGEPMDNVPKSLENDGHQVLEIEKQDGFYRVIVKKR